MEDMQNKMADVRWEKKVEQLSSAGNFPLQKTIETSSGRIFHTTNFWNELGVT